MRINVMAFAQLGGVACLIALPAIAQPAPTATFSFNIPAQRLETALLTVARISGRQIIFESSLVVGKRSPRLTGKFGVAEALRRLLTASGLSTREDGDALVIIGGAGPVVDKDVDKDVVVTGSRIRGAQHYSQVTTIDRQALREQGQTELGGAIRATLPQNFGGGQSPVIGVGAEDYGSSNTSSGSAINLRGLGPDATLTLLNGHRLGYDGASEGVDIDSIPLSAINRIEVVADGTSAIYGSDAVAGVANIVLRRDYSGLETAGRLGVATEGGDFQQQAETVAGQIWSSGGVIAAASYTHDSGVNAGQRDFSRSSDPTTTLLPSLHQLDVVLSGHQTVADGAEFGLDLTFSHRTARSTFSSSAGSYRQNGVERNYFSKSFSASPSLKLSLGTSWSATVAGTYALNDAANHSLFYDSDAVIIDYRGDYLNQSYAGEISAEGALIALPGGDARLAAGGGYRRVTLKETGIDAVDPPIDLRGGRESIYAFGELNVPLVGASNRTRGVDRLSFNAAGRYEHYPHIGDVFTPKLGILYAPLPAIELRGTWGRSFKAPTLYQLYEATGGFSLPSNYFGGSSDTQNVLAIYGGNADLKPQRATTWSTGGVLTPYADGRLKVQASYFSIHYTDRIVTPFTSESTALNDPRVADLVDFDPTSDQVSAVVTGLETPLQYYGAGDFDPANFAAILDDRYRNAASERYRGVDASVDYRLALPRSATLTLSASGTYLTSERRLSSGQPETPLAGHIFEPPHFRGRSGATYAGGGLSASAFVTIAGGVTDDRYAPTVQVDGQRSVDLSLGYAFRSARGAAKGLSIQLSMLNAFNDLPATVRNTDNFSTPFDSTNYDPVGRLISVRVAKQW